MGALSGRKVSGDGQLRVQIDGNSGEIWIPAEEADKDLAPVELEPIETSPVQQPIVEAAQKKESMTQQSAKPAPEEGVQMNTDGQHKAALKEETVAPVQVPDKPYEEMTVEELQQAVLQKLAKNGPVTEQMKKDVADNVYHDSLVNWVKSFR